MRSAAVSLALAVVAGLVPAAAAAPDPIDCAGPAGEAAPGTAAWHARELREAWCGEQRARVRCDDIRLGCSG
jgi:hypothetical protein